MYTETEFKKPKLGPVYPESATRVTFRIIGESNMREYKPEAPYAKEIAGGMTVKDYQYLAEKCQAFVNHYCTPLVRFDGADTKTVAQVLGGHQVDHFVTDHPLI